MPRLENWTLINRYDGYCDEMYQKLVGIVFGHPNADTTTGALCDRSSIVTSKIIRLDLENKVAITKSGTTYKLGTKDDSDNTKRYSDCY